MPIGAVARTEGDSPRPRHPITKERDMRANDCGKSGATHAREPAGRPGGTQRGIMRQGITQAGVETPAQTAEGRQATPAI